MLNRKDYQFKSLSSPARCLFCDLYVDSVCIADNDKSESDEFDCSVFGVNGEGYFTNISNNVNKK